MGISARGVSLFTLLMVVAAFADERQKTRFDSAQSTRLTEIHTLLAAKKASDARALAATHSAKIEATLKNDYETFGPHQRLAAADYAAAHLTQDVLDWVANHTMYSGQKVSTVMNYVLGEDYGVELVYNEGNWEAKVAGDGTTSVKKIRAALEKNIDKNLWASLSDENKDRVAKLAVSALGRNLKSMAKLEDNVGDELKNEFEKKSAELGSNTTGKIKELKDDFADAEVNDKTEKRLLVAEKDTLDAVKETATDKTADEFCAKFAAGLAAPEAVEAIQRRVRDGLICQEPLKTQLAEQSKKDGRSPAVLGPSERALFGDDKDKDEDDDSTADDDEDTKIASDDDDDDEKTPLSKKAQAKIDAQLAKIQQEATKWQSMFEKANGEKDQLQTALNMAQSCQRGVGSATDPLALNSNNQRNEKMLTTMRDEWGKVLNNNRANAVCEIAKGGDPTSAARRVVDGLVPTGALTEADQKTLRAMAEDSIEYVGQIASKRSTRIKYTAQIEETASKRALSRIATENSGAINAASIGYLKNLSHSALIGNVGYGYTDINYSALAKASPADPMATVQLYNDYFEIERMNLLEKFGNGDEFEQAAACALALAKEAGSRWSSEVGRTAQVFGPARQAAFNSLYSPTKVQNAPTSNRSQGI